MTIKQFNTFKLTFALQKEQGGEKYNAVEWEGGIGAMLRWNEYSSGMSIVSISGSRPFVRLSKSWYDVLT